MKKVFAIALIGGLVLASCSKKEDANKESNIMLEEPEATMIKDSSAVPATAPVEVLPAKADSATAK